jgi:hypothetical protein
MRVEFRDQSNAIARMRVLPFFAFDCCCRSRRHDVLSGNWPMTAKGPGYFFAASTAMACSVAADHAGETRKGASAARQA